MVILCCLKCSYLLLTFCLNPPPPPKLCMDVEQLKWLILLPVVHVLRVCTVPGVAQSPCLFVVLLTVCIYPWCCSEQTCLLLGFWHKMYNIQVIFSMSSFFFFFLAIARGKQVCQSLSYLWCCSESAAIPGVKRKVFSQCKGLLFSH